MAPAPFGDDESERDGGDRDAAAHTDTDGMVPPAIDCPPPTWDHDGDTATPCVDWTGCDAGQYVSQVGGAQTDRHCSPCRSGSFSGERNAAECAPWMECEAGQFVQGAPGRSADRSCSPCSVVEFSVASNASTCRPLSECPAGTYTAPAERDADVQCIECSSGYHCPGGSAEPEPCPGGTWDGGNPASGCQSHTVCPAGTFVAAGMGHTCGLVRDTGLVTCWGRNQYKQRIWRPLHRPQHRRLARLRAAGGRRQALLLGPRR